MAVESVDVVPAAVENPAVGSQRGGVLEGLEGRQGLHVAAVAVHGVEGENRHGAAVVATAADVAVGQIGLERPGRVLSRALEKRAFASGEKEDPAVAEVAAIEIVVASVSDTPRSAGQVHLVEMVKGVLRQIRLGHLVFDLGNFRIVLRVGHEQVSAVEVEIGTGEVACRKVRREAADGGLCRLEPFEHKHAASGPGPPAVVLVGKVRKLGRSAFDEQNRIEVEQRMAQHRPANRPASLPIGVRPLLLGRLGIEPADPLFDPTDRIAQGCHIDSHTGQFVGKPDAPPQGQRHNRRPVENGLRRPVGPLARAALQGRFAESDILAATRLEHLHLVEMKVARGGKLQADAASPPAVERHHQRLAVAVAVEYLAIVPVDLLESVAAIAQQDQDLGVAGRHAAVAAIVEHEPIQFDRFSQVDLPPGILLIGSVESPLAVNHPVAASGRIGSGQGRFRLEGKTESRLLEPILFDLSRLAHGGARHVVRLHRCGGTCAENRGRREHLEERRPFCRAAGPPAHASYPSAKRIPPPPVADRREAHHDSRGSWHRSLLHRAAGPASIGR